MNYIEFDYHLYLYELNLFPKTANQERGASMLEWIMSILKTTPNRWLSLAEGLPNDLATRQPLGGEWSAAECLLHLVDTEKVFMVRVEAFLAGEDFAAFNPDEQGSKLGEMSLAGLAEEFARLRASSLALLAKLRPQDLERRVRHQELGIVSLDEMLHEWAAHDLMHTVQAERAMMQPFIQSCGPWEKYFAAHVAAQKA